jgi:uncharacterized DUF497 family protein
MQFSWDDAKNVANYRKHGVWFEEAQTVWADARSSEFYDDTYEGDEQRFLRIGHSRPLTS